MNKEELKLRVCKAIDERSKEIVGIGEIIWNNPELGFKEFKTADLIAGKFKELGLECEEGIGITGVLAKVPGKANKPNIAVMGEMDSLSIPEHPEADTVTGAVHACGHNAQATNVVGLAIGLVESGIMEELDGSVTLMAVPSEEPVEIEWRQMMRERGKLHFLGGKQEFIRHGKFDDVDMALIDHLGTGTERKIFVRSAKDEPRPGSDGFIAKMIRFKGMEAHAGAAPEKGVNALNAAMLALMAIHAQRETFKDADAIRVHQVISKGGDVLNVIPSDIRMELMVRGASVKAIKDVCSKVDRALKAGAMAIGCEVEITDIPGYLPSVGGRGSPELSGILQENMIALLGAEQVGTRPPRIISVPMGGVSDVSDVASIVPLASMSVNAANGVGHSRDYSIIDKELAYVTPAKGYAMTIVDLLYDGAKLAKKIIAHYKAVVPKEAYMDYWRKIMGEE